MTPAHYTEEHLDAALADELAAPPAYADDGLDRLLRRGHELAPRPRHCRPEHRPAVVIHFPIHYWRTPDWRFSG